MKLLTTIPDRVRGTSDYKRALELIDSNFEKLFLNLQGINFDGAGIVPSLPSVTPKVLAFMGGTNTAPTWETVSLNLSIGMVTGVLDPSMGGTGIASYVAGDMLYATGSTTLTRLSIGTAGKIIRSTGSAPSWTSFTIPDTITSGGMWYASSANVVAVLAGPAGNSFIRWNGSAPAWSTPTIANSFTQGDLVHALTNNNLQPLAIGTANKVLTSSGTVPQWSTTIAYAALPTGGGTWTLGGNLTLSGAHVLFSLDNTYDIGASAATRPRTIYVGTQVIVGNSVSAGSFYASGDQPSFVSTFTGATGNARFSQWADNIAYVSGNLFQSSGSWYLDATGSAGGVLSVGSVTALRTATAGTNPRTLALAVRWATDGANSFPHYVHIDATTPYYLLSGTRASFQLIDGSNTEISRFFRPNQETVWLSQNVSYDGTNSNLDNTSYYGLVLATNIDTGSAGTRGWRFISYTAGTNPRTANLRAHITEPGALILSSSLTIADTKIMKTTTTFSNGAGVGAGTITNAPAAGNPTKWIPIDDNGTTRYIPAW